MTQPTPTPIRKTIHIRDTEIHYLEAGDGPPLLLLHGGLLSTDDVWRGHPAAHVSYLDTFASRFRVIAPDTRGHGRTLHHGGGPITYDELAEDVMALSSALGLDRPLVCGFSDGSMIATLVAIRSPGTVRALVNHAGVDLLIPETRALGRQVFGGSADAQEADPEAFARFNEAHGMADFVRRLRADHVRQAPGGWKTVVAGLFHRATEPSGVTFEDLRRISIPTLIMAGDRDMLCSAEQAVAAYRMLGSGELAIVPGMMHELSDAAVELMIGFLRGHAG